MTLISWMSHIPLYISTTTSLSIFLFPGIFKVYRSGGSWKQNSPKLWGACVLLIFNFPNLYTHEWKCPMLSKLCFLDVSGHTIHFSRVAVGNFHPAHEHNEVLISPWPLLHFWFLQFFRMTLLTDGKWDFFVVLICIYGLLRWPKSAYAFFPEYIQEKTHTPFLAKCTIVDILKLFMCFQGDSNPPPEICFLQFSLAFKASSLPSLNIFVDESYHL